MNTATTRRTFLGASAALAAISRTPASAAPAGELTLGVATYSLRKFSRAQAIEILKQLNVQHISVKEFHLRYVSTPEEIAAGRKDFAAAGMQILSGGNIDLKKPEELRKMFEYAKACGMPMMVCAPSHATLPEVEKLVKEFNIKAAIHNHGPEDKHFPSPQSVLKAVKDMDPRVGLCVDVGHTTRTGVDVVASLREAGPRLLDVHIKDLRDLMKAGSQCPVGDGAMPVVAIFKQLKQMNYKGAVMLEYEIDADNPLPGMMKSFAYMRGVLAGLRG